MKSQWKGLLSGNHTSKSRNKPITGAFKEAGIIEPYGSGIMRVRKMCKEHGVREPDFNEMADGFQVVLYNEKLAGMKNVLCQKKPPKLFLDRINRIFRN